MALDYLESNWKNLLEKYGGVIYTLPNMVNVVLNKLNSQKDLERVEHFMRTNELGIASRAFEESLDTIKANKKWMEKNLNLILKWLIKDKLKSGINENELEENIINYRIPKNLKPFNYDLFIQPFFKTTTMPEFFNASVRIDFTCVNDTTELILNMKNLELNNETMFIESLTDSNFTLEKNLIFSYSNHSQLFYAKLNQYFKQGHNYSFYVEFMGVIKEDNIGLYRSSYYDANFEKK